MKIALTTNGELLPRIRHFLNSIKKAGHEIIFHKEYRSPQADVWFFDRVYNGKDILKTNDERNNLWGPHFQNFKGKLYGMALCDGCITGAKTSSPAFVERLDGMISFMKFPSTHNYSHGLENKWVLIPRYTVDWEVREPKKKENKIFFVGAKTGSNFFDGKNWRVESLKIIYKNEFLKNNFSGWLYSKETENLEYPDFTSNVHLNSEDFKNHLDAVTISLCLPGNSKWGFRHLQSFLCQNTIISFPLENDRGEWLFQDAFNECMYLLNPDLSNLEEICEEALTNTKKSSHFAKTAFLKYKECFELEQDNTYKQDKWDIIKSQFNQTGLSCL